MQGTGRGSFRAQTEARPVTSWLTPPPPLVPFPKKLPMTTLDTPVPSLLVQEMVPSTRFLQGHLGTIETRTLRDSDAEAVLSCLRGNRAYFEKGRLDNLPDLPTSYERWIQHRPRHPSELHGVFCNGACLGFVGIDVCRVGAMTEPALGIWYGFDKGQRGTGLATRSIAAVLVSYLERHPLRKTAVLHVHKTNLRSQQMAVRLGFAKDPSIDYRRYASMRGNGIALEGFSAPTATLQQNLPALLAEREAHALPARRIRPG